LPLLTSGKGLRPPEAIAYTSYDYSKTCILVRKDEMIEEGDVEIWPKYAILTNLAKTG
jgi:hypothetical protein